MQNEFCTAPFWLKWVRVLISVKCIVLVSVSTCTHCSECVYSFADFSEIINTGEILLYFISLYLQFRLPLGKYINNRYSGRISPIRSVRIEIISFS